MFCDFGIQKCNKFLTSDNFRTLINKHDRIRHVLRRFDLDRLIADAIERVIDISSRSRKQIAVAEHYLRCAEIMYSASGVDNLAERAKKSIKFSSKALLHAPFGDTTFVRALDIRAKCFLQIAEQEQALKDVDLAERFDPKFDAERALVKAICLFLRNRFKQLKDFLKSLNFERDELKNFSDATILSELKLTHLSFAYLRAFVGDPNFAYRTSKSDEALSDSLLSRYIEPLDTFQSNYELDSRCKIYNDRYKGRHFMASEFIAKGTVILVERSFSLTIDKESRLERCLLCQKICQSFVPCRHCTEVVFCDYDCMKQAWKLFHRYECTLLSLFKDTFNVSLHMYRTISIIGAKSALEIERNLLEQQNKFLLQQKHAVAADVDIRSKSGYREKEKKAKNITDRTKKAKEELKQAKNLLNDKLIREYLDDASLRTTVNFRQNQHQLEKVYRMNKTLLDHNETYEEYYDVCYMGVSIDVALLLFLRLFLIENDRNQANSDAEIEKEGIVWDRLLVKRPENIGDFDDTQTLMSVGTIGEFIRLIGIVQLNIRKLVTNVFSWNIYDDSYQVKKNVATCQCLIGSLINHSCDPNVEWDFKNGCIVYITTRDINAGQEINNSYGPHRSTPFVDRQHLLSANYYFNCCCEQCRKQVAQHENVLRCLTCEDGGPVVCQAEFVVDATCMQCHAIYPDIQSRMKKVNRMRIRFNTLLHFANAASDINREKVEEDEENGGAGVPAIATDYLNELIETMNYQLKYCYAKSAQLQANLQAFCRLLCRVSRQKDACYYGQFQQIVDHHYNHRHQPVVNRSSKRNKKNYESALSYLENSIFWFQLYCNFVRQYSIPEIDVDDTTTDDDCRPHHHNSDMQLFAKAKELVSHHFASIRFNILQLVKWYECEDARVANNRRHQNKKNSKIEINNEKEKEEVDGEKERVEEMKNAEKEIEEEEAEDEEAEEDEDLLDFLNDSENSDNVYASGKSFSVKRMLFDVLQRCNSQYSAYSITEKLRQ